MAFNLFRKKAKAGREGPEDPNQDSEGEGAGRVAADAPMAFEEMPARRPSTGSWADADTPADAATGAGSAGQLTTVQRQRPGTTRGRSGGTPAKGRRAARGKARSRTASRARPARKRAPARKTNQRSAKASKKR